MGENLVTRLKQMFETHPNNYTNVAPAFHVEASYDKCQNPLKEYA